MDAIHSWIDKDEVGRLAEKLSTSPERMKDWKKLESDGFAIPEKQGEQMNTEDQDVEEQPNDLPKEELDKQSSILAGASRLAKSSGLTHSEKKPAILEEINTQKTEEVLEQIEATQVEVPRTPPSDAKGTFILIQELYTKDLNDAGLCIIDRDGDVLYDSFENLSLTKFTVNVMKTSSLMQVEDEAIGSLRIKHSATEVIEFLSVNCSRGVVLVAAKLNQGLGVDQRQQLAQNIRQILNAH